MSDEGASRDVSRIDAYDVYKESELLLQHSILIYVVSDIRALARNGKLTGDPALIERALGVGYTAEETVLGRLCAENKENLEKEFGKESIEIYMSSLELLKTQTAKLRLEAFDDQHHSSGCVYAILVDDDRKRIVVVFRGSACAKDWLADSRTFLKAIPNPLNDIDYDVLGVHAGFHDYLFSVTNSNLPDKDPQSKCDMILEEVAQLLEQNPGYHICTTGHSLGASLSTLFAFKVATSNDDRITKPVMCVNFASPRPGDSSFRDAFQLLEKKGHVRCLRFVNHGDVITNMPASQFSHFCLLTPGIFRHVGMEVELFTERKKFVSFVYAAPGQRGRRFQGDIKKCMEQSLFAVTLPFQCLRGKTYMLRHSCLEYLKHVRSFRGDLEKVRVCDLYEDVYEDKGKFNVRESLSS